jgi:hypothetical protein
MSDRERPSLDDGEHDRELEDALQRLTPEEREAFSHAIISGVIACLDELLGESRRQSAEDAKDGEKANST